MAQGSCGRCGWESFEDFGDRSASVAKDRFGTNDDGRADVQLGEEGSNPGPTMSLWSDIQPLWCTANPCTNRTI